MTKSRKVKLLQGSASNMVRMILGMFVSLLLPPFLVHRMPPAEYSAWVLILQLSAYVSFLDFGLQTAIGKFIAEYDATGDREASRRMMSTAFTVLAAAAVAGIALVGILTYRVPQLFHQMPPALVHDVRAGLLCVGISVSVMLPFCVFMTAFSGLQEYGFPTVFLSISRIGAAVALVVVILLHGTLTEMALVTGALNLATAFFEFLGWKKYASRRVEFSFLLFDRPSFRLLLEYCGVLSIWTVGGLFISGLDTTIVGRYDFANTGYYAIASSATNFMLMLVSNIFGPLLPALSSLQTERTPEQMGALLIRTTRLSVSLLCLFGLPLLFGAYPLLSIWVGHAYAARSVVFLHVLVIANMVRQLGYPYALFTVASGKQRYATAAPIVEAVVNFACSILLAKHYGAIGVALGTLIGAFVGIAVHLMVSMHYTQNTIRLPRTLFAQQGLLPPLLSILPLVLLFPLWRRLNMLPMPPVWIAAWVLSTGALLWWAGLSTRDRSEVRRTLGRLLYST